MARLPRLPDLLTTANLCCGTASILLASQGQLTMACGLIFLAAVFDVFDGLAARALGGGSPLGAQLDSLADMVSFGVAPAMLLFFRSYELMFDALPTDVDGRPVMTTLTEAFDHSIANWTLRCAVIVLVAASAWRLAKFNIDTRQTHGFLGLPTPSNGLFWVAVVLGSTGAAVHPGPGHDLLISDAQLLVRTPYAVLVVAIALAVLMLSEIPLPSLKFTHKGWKGNEVIFILIGIGAVLVALYGVLAVPLILILYMLSPFWGKLFPKTT